MEKIIVLSGNRSNNESGTGNQEHGVGNKEVVSGYNPPHSLTPSRLRSHVLTFSRSYSLTLLLSCTSHILTLLRLCQVLILIVQK